MSTQTSTTTTIPNGISSTEPLLIFAAWQYWRVAVAVQLSRAAQRHSCANQGKVRVSLTALTEECRRGAAIPNQNLTAQGARISPLNNSVSLGQGRLI